MKQYQPDPRSTPTGIAFGIAICHREMAYCKDAELLQAALLLPATAKPQSTWSRITMRLRRLLS